MPSHAQRACKARALRAPKTLTLRFTDFFTDFEKKKSTVLQSIPYYTSLIILKWKDYPASRVSFDLLREIKGPWKEIMLERVWKNTILRH